ncbi:MAG TPA: hypothetical protein VLN08_01585 [Vicinamibacterales bacterium]|nr:hypothetical protein [Vicinamibacterales bacterium]
MRIESDGWGGEGTFTAVLLEALKAIDTIEYLRVEDAPASRAEPGYAFISNEIYVGFKTESRTETRTRLGLPWRTRVAVRQMTLEGLATRLGPADGVAEPDYGDDGMLQYLRTERIVAPYQTRGVKVVELVRIYEVGTARRES